jgi:uncharacterized protein (TIGR02996 family)
MSDGPALLAAIRANPLELTPQLMYLDWAKENPDAVRAMLEAACEAIPRLTANGVGIGDQKDDTPAKRVERFHAWRAELLREHVAFAASMAWLATRGKRKSVDGNSYSYKHAVERHWNDKTPARYVYVPNGAFIAAVVCSGFTWAYHYGPNVTVGISRKSLARPPLVRSPYAGLR